MSLSIEDKQSVVKELNTIASSSVSGAIADYSGLNVAEITELRTKAREAGVYLKVVKNTLSKRAFLDTSFECLSESLKGPIIIAFSEDDLASPARLFKNFSKEYEQLQTVSLAIDGNTFPATDLDIIAQLPTKQEAYSTIANLLQAPIEKAVRTFKEIRSKFTRMAVAVKDNKEKVS